MAWLEDTFGSTLLPVSGLFVGALLLKRLTPGASLSLGSLALGGLKLFAEAEFEMQDGIISTLAENAVSELLATMPSGHPGELSAPAQKIIEKFEHAARTRSARHSWHDRDKHARYRHHVHKLKAAIAAASGTLPEAQQAYLRSASAEITEDW